MFQNNFGSRFAELNLPDDQNQVLSHMKEHDQQICPSQKFYVGTRVLKNERKFNNNLIAKLEHVFVFVYRQK